MSSDSAGGKRPGPVRVLFAAQFPPPLGGQNVVRKNIFTHLREDPGVAAVHLEMNFVSSFSQARRASLRKALELLRVLARALRFRLAGRFDLLMYPAGGPQSVPMIRDILLLPVLTRLAERTIVNFHAAGIADRLEATSGWLERLLVAVYRRVDVAVVMTDFNRRDPQALGIRSTVIIPHRIRDANPERRLPDFSPSLPPRFVYMGHLYDQKGTPQLIEAFGRLRADFPEARLCLIGDFINPYGPDRFQADLERWRVQDAVEWTGSLSGTAKATQLFGCNCFVFPSVAPYESFGLVLVEAMMHGLPILVSDWRGNKDVVGADFGGVAFPVSPSLVDGIEFGLRSAMKERDRWEAWGRKNREVYERNFRSAGECEDYLPWVKRRFMPEESTEPIQRRTKSL